MWGEAPINFADVYEIFAKYIEGKIPILPWCEAPLQPETSIVSNPIADLNRKGFLSINSQPAVNGKGDNDFSISF
jgi:methylenetetrahydrofolate reductase (NADPH)